mgnify:CR=1 FL=1
MYNKEEYLFTVYNPLYHSPASFQFCNWKTFSKAEKDMFFIPYCSFSIESDTPTIEIVGFLCTKPSL